MFETLTKNLLSRGFQVSRFYTVEDASAYLNEQINGKTVGFGGSVTLDQMGLYQSLGAHNEVFWHWNVADKAKSVELRNQASRAQIYLSSVNAIAESGEIINIDGTCNRVASIFYGHEKVYLIVGKNKIERDYNSALFRARNVAAPLNAKRVGAKTPCAIKSGRCFDCKSPERICRGLSVLWGKPMAEDCEIVLIDQPLGY